jgi:hypothetical protein
MLSARLFLCKDPECSTRRDEPISVAVVVDPTASSTASSTSAAANMAAVAARQLVQDMARTGTVFIGRNRQRTTSFYVGKHLPRGVEILPNPALPSDANQAPSESTDNQQEDPS